MVCLHAAPRVQLFASAGNRWPHNALRCHYLMPISYHFRYCKALLSMCSWWSSLYLYLYLLCIRDEEPFKSNISESACAITTWSFISSLRQIFDRKWHCCVFYSCIAWAKGLQPKATSDINLRQKYLRNLIDSLKEHIILHKVMHCIQCHNMSSQFLIRSY